MAGARRRWRSRSCSRRRLSAEGESLNEAYRRVSTSVVVIRARGQEVTAEGTVTFKEIGSGVLISPDGKVATAAHVVQTMEDITVEFLGEEPVPARVIASEQWADISILQVSVVPRERHGVEARRLRPRPSSAIRSSSSARPTVSAIR